jgi:cation:H+ antiporter
VLWGRRSGCGALFPWFDLAALLLLVGLALLVGGAELLVRGGGQLALGLRVPALIVGLTVVSFGTSAPELAVSVSAAWSGNTDAAIANVIGSNIANVLLVLGVSSLLRPLLVDRSLVRRELPTLLLLQAVLPLMCLDGRLTMVDGVLLLAIGLIFNLLLVVQAIRERGMTQPSGPPATRWWLDLLLLAGGVVALVGGAQLFVGGAIEIARWLSFTDRFVGLTVIALGTSAPELVTTAVGAWKGEVDIAIGNVVGSNILNIAIVLGITSILHPITFEDPMLWFDVVVSLGAATILIPIALFAGRIGRPLGALMMATYVFYLWASY